jgi:hypothetical protein
VRYLISTMNLFDIDFGNIEDGFVN